MKWHLREPSIPHQEIYNLPWPQGCWEHKLSLLSSRDPLNMLSLKDPSQSIVVNKIVLQRSIFIFLFLLVTHNQSSTSSIYICSHWFFFFGPQINRWSVASDWESYLFSLISSHHNIYGSRTLFLSFFFVLLNGSLGFASTYHIFIYHSVPGSTVRDNDRVYLPEVMM